MQTLYFIPNRLCKMGFTQTYSTINNQWIKRICTWFFGNSFTGTSGNTITISFHKRIKSVHMIELWVDLHFFQTWNHKRILHRIINHQREIHLVVIICFHVAGWNIHGTITTIGITTIQRFRQKVNIMLLQVFIEELTGYLY